MLNPLYTTFAEPSHLLLKPSIGHHRLDSHSRGPLALGFLALGIRFLRFVDPHPESQPLASVREALEVPVEIRNVDQLLPGRIKIPAPSRYIGLRRAELALVARWRLHQPLDRIGARERRDIFSFAPQEHGRDP